MFALSSSGFALHGMKRRMKENAVKVDADAVEAGFANGRLGAEIVAGRHARHALNGAERVIGQHAGEIAQFAAGQTGGQIPIGGKRAGGHLDAVRLAERVRLQAILSSTPARAVSVKGR